MSLLMDQAPVETAHLMSLLDKTGQAGHPARFWWRDDDAQIDGPKLQQLYSISQTTGMPLVLAVIPDGCDDSLLTGLPNNGCIFQHGVVHRQMQIPGAKKCEFPETRPAREMFAALNTGREKLALLYGDRFRPCLVPPWNRYPDSLKDLLPKAGFTHLSRYKSPDPAKLLPDLGEINSHVDIIDWQSRSFLGTAASLDLVITHLEDKLAGRSPMDEVTGILSHHIDHDAGCDRFLDALFRLIMAHPAAEAVSGQDLTV